MDYSLLFYDFPDRRDPPCFKACFRKTVKKVSEIHLASLSFLSFLPARLSFLSFLPARLYLRVISAGQALPPGY